MENIRKANINDIVQVNKLLYEVQKIHSDSRPDLFRRGAKKYTDDQLRSIFENMRTPVFVYELDGELLGYAFCIFKQILDSNTLTDIKTLYIDDLCVEECARGHHVGTKLYNYVINFAKENNCYNVTLNVWANNKKAIEFYRAIVLTVQKIGMEKILK